MMRGRKGQRDTKPTPLHSMNDIPRDGYTGFPRAWPMSQEKRRCVDSVQGHSIMGNTSAYADVAGYDRCPPLSERIQGGGCVVTGPYHTDMDGQLSSAGKHLNTET